MFTPGYFRLRASFNIPSVSAGVVGVVIGRSLGGGGGGGGALLFVTKLRLISSKMPRSSGAV